MFLAVAYIHSQIHHTKVVVEVTQSVRVSALEIKTSRTEKYIRKKEKIDVEVES